MKLRNLLLMAALVAAPGAARADAITDATKALEAGAKWLKGRDAPTKASTKGFGPNAYDGWIAAGEACAKAVAAVDGSASVTIAGVETTFAEAGATYCQTQIDWGKAADALVDEWERELRLEKGQKYIDAGIKGERLELFIEYDSVYWMGKNCETIYDVAVLKKAKKLFQWLVNSDGTHTIRTYTFKGNKVKSVKDRTYPTEAKAYKGCK